MTSVAVDGEEEEAAIATSLGFPLYERSPLSSKTSQAITLFLSLFDQSFPNIAQIVPQKQGHQPVATSVVNQVTDCRVSKLIELGVKVRRDSEIEQGEISETSSREQTDVLSVPSPVTVDQSLIKKHELPQRKVCDYNEIYAANNRNWAAAAAAAGGGCNKRPKLDSKPDDSKSVVKENDGKTANVKEGVEACVKKPRVVTEERKKKKKEQRRKKRAEQDRQSGVKRLKLQPIVKPKTVNYCKYYRNGKCQQGDACKFSHDLTPVTKSEACRFLPLNMCLKGSDCPYDHELSKYPCDNYQSQGFCSRGDACLFSHKIPLVNGSTPVSDVSKKAQETLSLQGRASKPPSKRLTSQSTHYTSLNIAQMKPASSGTITRSPGQNVADVRPPAEAPKGMSFLSFGKAPDMRPPAQAPKGLSFLSFGKAPGDDSSKQQKGDLSASSSNTSVTLCNVSQGASEKLNISNEEFGRTPTSTLSSPQSSKMIANGQYKNIFNSAYTVVPLAPQFTSKYENKLMDQSVQLPSTSPLAPKRDTQMDRSVQPAPSNGNITAFTSILQEFLFNGK